MAIRILENPLSSKNIGFRIEVKIRTPFKEEEPDQPYCYFFIIYVGLYGRGFSLRGSGVTVFTTNQIMGRDFSQLFLESYLDKYRPAPILEELM